MTRVNDVPAVSTSGEEAQRLVADSGGGASLEKVRDILFGVQMREIERRFARLEDRLSKETSELKDEVRRRLEALESYARQESEALADQIGKEQTARTDATRDLSREISDTAKSFERRAAALDDQLTKSQRESRQQMLEQHHRLSDDIRTRVDEVLATLAREAQELRSDKADRAVLASLFNELALRLTNGLTIPGGEELGNA